MKGMLFYCSSWLGIRGSLMGMIVVSVMLGFMSVGFCTSNLIETVQAKLSLEKMDAKGGVHRPFKLDDGAKASILFFVTHDCPVTNKYSREIQRIVTEYGKHKIKSCLVYVDPDMTLKDVAKHMKDFGYGDLTAFLDKQHELVKATGAEVTPEAVVIVGKGVIAYRGRIDNFYEELGVGRKQVTKRELRKALDAILKGQKVSVPRAKAVGCFIPPLK